MKYLKLFLAKASWSAFKSIFFCAVFTVALPLISFGQFPTDFQKVDLVTELKNSVDMEFAPDGRIFILDRFGEIIVYNPETQISVIAGTLDVFKDMEEGLIGIAFDPHFAHNNFVYIHYSHPIIPKNLVSRFKMEGDLLDLSSEIVVIEWQSDRNGYYHAAGDMDFDSQGNLYIAIGDNTNHSHYGTLDEADQHRSSERTSSNTNDLRGKILRIKPLADGTYSIPPDNLFPDGVGGLPEIYVMGARNPYKIFVDKTNNDWLFWGDVGPDAPSASNLGPEGLDEINLTKEAGNYGWPYFSGKNRPYLNTYTDPNFYYDPEKPVNLSKWNTGEVNLPPAKPAWMDFYKECYMAGPRYHYDASLYNPKKLPADFDGAFFHFDFNKSKIWVSNVDDSGNILSTEPFAADKIKGAGFIDLKIGPDGQLYLLEYGAGCCPKNTGTGKLARLDYNGIDINQAPQVSISADVTSGSLPLMVNFSSEGTFDPDGDELMYEWDFQSDGIVDSNEQHPSFTYTVKGTFNALLRVNDSNGGISSSSITIHAGNNAPTFEFVYPPDGGMFDWRDNLDYHIIVNDVEDGSTADGTIDCSLLNFVPALGHLSHAHDGLSVNECEGTYLLDPSTHDTNGFDDIYQVFRVNFTDSDGLTTYDQITIHPKLMEAEFYDLQNNTDLVDNTDVLGGGKYAVRALTHGAYLMLENRNLHNIESVSFRVASSLGGNIEVRAGSPDGTLISSVAVPNTGSTNDWMIVEAPITNPEGANDLYFVFTNTSATAPLFDLNYIEFLGAGVSIDNSPPEIYLISIPSPNSVSIKFNEPLDKVSAEQVSNYAINNGMTVSSATLQADRRTVLLTTSNLGVKVENELTVSNLVNESGIMINNNLVKKFTFEGELFRINAGGTAMEINGIQWGPTQYNNGGTSYSANDTEISNTNAAPLYLSETYGDFTYEIPVPNSGIYDVSLHFAELYFKNPGDRVFNVEIENGQYAIPNYDIFAHVGFAVADIKKFHGINVEDGFLTITFTSVKNQAKVSAIEVFLGSGIEQQPSIKILNPMDEALVSQPFTVNFQAYNWEMGEGTTHIHKLVDGVNTGEVYDLTAISFDDLTPGQHDIQLVLANADHSHTEYSAQVKVNVIDDGCVDMEFPLNWTEQIIGDEVEYRSVYIFSEDLDGDGFKDIVTGGWWYKNPGTRDGTWIRNEIGAPMNNMSLIYDFDNDGDMDIFGTQGTYKDEEAKMAWAENDGNGNFTIHTNIPNGTSTHDETFMAGAALGNFNDVANIQIAVTWNGGESNGSPVQMLTVPADPVNQAWTIESISQDSFGEAISAGDIDGDGDLDLFQAGNWLRNDNGTWTTFSTALALPTDFDRSALADLDKDGSLDGIVTQIGDNQEISWIKSPIDPTQTWTKETIGYGLYGALSLSVVDMDGDGDLDIITGEWKGEHRLLAFENDLCNTGTWIPHVLHPGGPMDHHDGTIPVDLDNDGNLDIISIGWNQRIPRIYWSETNEESAPGVLNPIQDQTASDGGAFSFTFAGNTFSGNELTYTALLPDGNYLPQWLTFDGPTRTFSGTPGPSDMGSFEVMVTASDGSLSASNVFNLTVTEAVKIALRINTGGGEFTANGKTFVADGAFSGGKVYTNTGITEIAGTNQAELYRSERYGIFGYNIPLPIGTYTVRLHFAEIYYGATGGGSGGVGRRIFNVSGEGRPLLSNFDIYAEVGAMTALIKEFDLDVTDGALNLSFSGVVENAKISAIEILTKGAFGELTANSTSLQFDQQVAGTTSEPKTVTLTNNENSELEINSIQITGDNGSGFAHDFTAPVTLGAGASATFNVTFTPASAGAKEAQLEVMHTGIFPPLIIRLRGEGVEPVVVPLRINTGGGELTAYGETFAADGFFSGGNTYTNTRIADTDIGGTTEYELYRSERNGNFSYIVPLKSGTYTVRLHFAEIYFGATGGGSGSVGRRIFNVSGEGQPLLTDFDIFAEVGAMAALTKAFNLEVTDGFLNLSFVGVVENAKVSAIEVLNLSGDDLITSIHQDNSESNSLNGKVQLINPGRMASRESGKVKVYPNPFDDLIYIEFLAEASQEYYITLYDLTGKIVVQESVTSKSTGEINHLLDLSHKYLTTGGVYLVFIESKNGSFLEIFKVVKK